VSERDAEAGPSPLDPFFSRTEIREHHQTIVCAPASLVFEAARSLKLGSIWEVQAIFRLRAKMMRARGTEGTEMTRGFVDEALAMGWGTMIDQPGRLFVAGGYCQPWVADVKFRALSREAFTTFAEPNQVKIAWTLEAQPLDASRTRFITETRAMATDEEARRHFRRYLAVFKIGIVAIRWLMVPAVRRQAERRWRTGSTAP